MPSVAHETADVLVLGGGGAALRAAIAAAEHPSRLKVLLATKGALGRSGVTATACSDRMAFHVTLPSTEPREPYSWVHHADDVYRIGGYVSDYDLAAIQAREAAGVFEYLDQLGVPWVRRPDGTPDQFVTDGSEYARACYTGPYTANHIEEALVRRARALPNLHVLEGVCATDLLRGRDGGIAGALLLTEGGNERLAVTAGAVVLGTGGAGQVFEVNVFPPDCTGDGYAMAYRAGAELVNMEFIQIGLCSVATGLAMSGSMMRALPRLVNDAGEEVLFRYLPPGTPASEAYGILFSKGASWPVSLEQPSHALDIAVTYERAQGRRVYLDYSANPEGLDVAELPDTVRRWYQETKGVPLDEEPYRSSPLARLMAINLPSVEWLAERGVDLPAGQPAEIAPAAQHFQGGVKIRTYAQTSLPGLYAAGEVAGGQHGANRPGGNALMDSQVFGRIAGESAAWLASRRTPALDEASLAEANARLDALATYAAGSAELRRAVQSAVSAGAGVVRTDAGLAEGLQRLEHLKRSHPASGPGNLVHAVETANLLTVAEMVLRAAEVRTESRGPHLRFAAVGDLTPVPSSPHWRQYIVIRKGDPDMQLEIQQPVEPRT
ncbi:MAG: FAD-binding protein [Anaerolineae bacterium]|jgi:succinate dehydrogenase/fumarate reductase flavoprotein subunit